MEATLFTKVAVVVILVTVLYTYPSFATLPDYLPIFNTGITEKGQLIETYFHFGFSYKEILSFLGIYHGIKLGYRQLLRKLKEKGLRRKSVRPADNSLVDAIQTELCTASRDLGYRSMHQRILHKYNIAASRESVRIILKHLDPIGVTRRRQRRLHRREYYVKGPNFLWHIDGWDKLKQFGLCVHGCIDGYSRRLMWLEVSSTNNDPNVVCRYFAKCIRQIQGLPCTVRADRGTENVNVESMQTVLRQINTVGSNHDMVAFLYGKSTANQRIESWWSKFGMLGMNVWIYHFKAMSNMGIIDTSDELDIQCIIFCYVRLLQEELQHIAQLWNTHYIRKSRNEHQPHGRPDTMYHLPEMFGGINGLQTFHEDDADVLSDILTKPIPLCKDSYRELFCLLITEKAKSLPKSLEEAQNLLVFLLDTIHNSLDQQP